LKLEWKENATLIVADGVDLERCIVCQALQTLPIEDVVFGRHGGSPLDPFMMYTIKGVVVHKVGAVEQGVSGMCKR
jgi:hypothetical protein